MPQASGHHQLTFNYTVVSGDSSSDIRLLCRHLLASMTWHVYDIFRIRWIRANTTLVAPAGGRLAWLQQGNRIDGTPPPTCRAFPHRRQRHLRHHQTIPSPSNSPRRDVTTPGPTGALADLKAL